MAEKHWLDEDVETRAVGKSASINESSRIEQIAC